MSLLIAMVLLAGPPELEQLRLQRGMTSGGYTEFQVAPANDKPDWSTFTHWKKDSAFLHYEGMTLLWKPFSAADPAFDVFMPRLFDPARLLRLVTALQEFKKEWLALDTLAAARTRWGKLSAVVEGLKTEKDWLAARQTLAKTVDELITWAQQLAKKNQWAWVLGA